jgi:diguanylate cyclase (GGDEF)-like protein
MYKIAFLSYDWNSEVVTKLAEGIHQFILHHGDVSIHFFNGFGDYGVEEADEGALQIFNLPYLESYDGLIMQGGRVWTQEARQIIADRAIKAGIPVVSVNYPLKGCVEVSSDNYGGMAMAVRHLIQDHHIKSAAFVRGQSVSPEAQEREKAFRDVCRENGLKNVSFYNGNWAAQDGMTAARDMIIGQNVPEAIICSNDSQAYGAVRELQGHGYKIPSDVMVTGFDNLEMAEYCDPSITTVDRSYEEIAYAAIDTVWIHLHTGVQTGDIPIPCRLIERGSCGHLDDTKGLKEVRKKYLDLQNDIHNFYGLRDKMQKKLEHCGNLEDIANVVEHYGAQMLCGNVYFVMNGLYYDDYENAASVRHYGDHMYLMGIYESGKKYTPDSRHIYASFDRKEVLPAGMVDSRHVLTVYPLRYDEIVIGYIVMTGFSDHIGANLLSILFTIIDNAIENQRRKYKVDTLNKSLSDLYVTDQLTGLYNRFGMEKYAEPMYETAMKQNREIEIVFVDVDNLKKTNDNYGHDAGDLAVGMAANAIRRTTKGTPGVGIRYGGDEFLIVGGYDLIQRLDKNVQEEIRLRKPTFPFSVSIGSFTATGREGFTLQQAIDHADDRMYTAKKKRKAEEACTCKG